mmetsp:Transcript_19083/g.45246  ORF Transcript_19083/g.45246 Transcript_19083/m.45246 type:complete len:300 (+) Transcript_19083:68-967(+)|eukprot:CAMPEP_0181427924 /NCGR_PEP_ID=MMETSP1110-20121109/16416_1 /TAXON_ID=174948 /ORGANISM="Symbiodinium sp., Strain CCMP421" /LENGTH=299 /DNA_ID=CAMNT_0023551139 /DNA_START=62 /DNA_END=961 /DNA_ORIENTATION=+
MSKIDLRMFNTAQGEVFDQVFDRRQMPGVGAIQPPRFHEEKAFQLPGVMHQGFGYPRDSSQGYVLGLSQNMQIPIKTGPGVYYQNNLSPPFNCYLIGGDSPKDVQLPSIPQSPASPYIQGVQVVPVISPAASPQKSSQKENFFAPSEGSIGHPELCRRPCFYFARGCCEDGASCGYCHLPHGEKAPKLDKRQRLVLQSLPEITLLEMLQQRLRVKATQQGLAGSIGEILQLWQRRLMFLRMAPNSHEPVADRYVRNLDKILRRMNISELVALAIRGAKDDVAYVDELREALARLRKGAR